MVLIALLLSATLSLSLEVKRVCTDVIEGVLQCRSAIKEGALVPQVCGKCRLELEDGKLYIKPAEGCPRYNALLCELKSGEIFLINNLSCEPELKKVK